jgi:hypothetical protein
MHLDRSITVQEPGFAPAPAMIAAARGSIDEWI